MKFSAVIVAFTFAAAATAKTCGINGALCSYEVSTAYDGALANSNRRDVSSVGFTAKAREWLRTREAAPVEAREAEPEAVEVQI